jgi:hypothetical protein
MYGPPCNHNPPKLPPEGQPYSAEFCRLCWLFKHHPFYREMWSKDRPAVTVKKKPCCHD